MAAAMQNISTTEGEDVDRLCTCGNKISSKDTHPVCSTCLGVKHAQAALDNAGLCEHCARFTAKTLRRRLARQASLTGNDPLLSTASLAQMTAQQTAMSQEQPTMAARSWSEQVDAYDPLSQDMEELESEDGDDYEMNSDLLVSDDEDDFDAPFLPSAQALNSSSTLASEKEAPPSPLISLDLQDVCKRAADKLAIPWPTVTAETAKSRYEGKRLPMAKRSARQLLPIFPELLEELSVTWKDKPFTCKTPIQGGSVLDLEGMEKEGLFRMPAMEPLVAAHLQPRRLTTATPTLPSKAERLQSSLSERAYKAVALSARALNVISILTAYQAEIQEEMTANPGPTKWDEICVITDLSLRLQRCAVQAAGRAMATMVVQERARWLNLANLSDREKEAIMDAPIVSDGVFGTALAHMQKRCEEKKRDDEALQLCLPRKPQPGPSAFPHQTFPQAAARPAPGYRYQKRPRPQVATPTQGAPQEVKPAWRKKPGSHAAPPAGQSAPHPNPGARRKKMTA